jgi:hypothetical protein
MSYGLCGAHRTGKTTLAKAVADEFKIEFVETSVSDVWKKLGISLKDPLPFDVRMDAQEQILQAAIERWESSRVIFIADRTPLDMMAYTMADINGSTELTKDQNNRFLDYMNDCYDATEKYFTVLVVVQPGIEIVEDETKVTALSSLPYMEHLNSLITGFIMHTEGVAGFALPRYCTDMSERIAFVSRKIQSQCPYAPSGNKKILRLH